jgi:hypothetical protein
MTKDPHSGMSAAPLGPNLGPLSDEREQKRLWLDYIKTLNERRLQSAQRSGFTTYLVLAALAGVAYRFIPKLPSFLEIPGSVRSASTFLMLETDILFFAAGVLAMIATYCNQGMETRVIPEHRRRVTQFAVIILIFLVAVIAAGHLLVVWRLAPSSPWVRRGLITLCVFWFANLLAVTWKEIRMIRKSVANRVPIPRFSALEIEPTLFHSFLGIAMFGLPGTVAGFSLVLYARSFSADWSLPWKAASTSLAFIGLAFYLLNRFALSIGQDSYFELERDVLLKDLSVEDIRTTFLRQFVGLDAAQWLDGLLSELKASNEDSKHSIELGRKQLSEIRGIDVTYLAERVSRAGKLVGERKIQNKKEKLQTGQLRFRLQLFFEIHLGPREREARAQWEQQFSAELDESVRISEDGTAFLSDVEALVKDLAEPQRNSGG